jgi:hypothetical protein
MKTGKQIWMDENIIIGVAAREIKRGEFVRLNLNFNENTEDIIFNSNFKIDEKIKKREEIKNGSTTQKIL